MSFHKRKSNKSKKYSNRTKKNPNNKLFADKLIVDWGKDNIDDKIILNPENYRDTIKYVEYGYVYDIVNVYISDLILIRTKNNKFYFLHETEQNIELSKCIRQGGYKIKFNESSFEIMSIDIVSMLKNNQPEKLRNSILITGVCDPELDEFVYCRELALALKSLYATYTFENQRMIDNDMAYIKEIINNINMRYESDYETIVMIKEQAIYMSTSEYKKCCLDIMRYVNDLDTKSDRYHAACEKEGLNLPDIYKWALMQDQMIEEWNNNKETVKLNSSYAKYTLSMIDTYPPEWGRLVKRHEDDYNGPWIDDHYLHLILKYWPDRFEQILSKENQEYCKPIYNLYINKYHKT
jgi:hypothetical protein